MKKTEDPNEFVSNMRTDKSYSETVKNDGNKTANNDGNKKSKKNTEKVKEKDEDFQDPKVIKDTAQIYELKEFMKTIAEKVEALITKRNYFHQWN